MYVCMYVCMNVCKEWLYVSGQRYGILQPSCFVEGVTCVARTWIGEGRDKERVVAKVVTGLLLTTNRAEGGSDSKQNSFVGRGKD